MVRFRVNTEDAAALQEAALLCEAQNYLESVSRNSYQFLVEASKAGDVAAGLRKSGVQFEVIEGVMSEPEDVQQALVDTTFAQGEAGKPKQSGSLQGLWKIVNPFTLEDEVIDSWEQVRARLMEYGAVPPAEPVYEGQVLFESNIGSLKLEAYAPPAEQVYFGEDLPDEEEYVGQTLFPGREEEYPFGETARTPMTVFREGREVAEVVVESVKRKSGDRGLGIVAGTFVIDEVLAEGACRGRVRGALLDPRGQATRVEGERLFEGRVNPLRGVTESAEPPQKLRVVNDRGRAFNVTVGERNGKPTVRFYDATYEDDLRFTVGLGQYVSEYYLETLESDINPYGLDLHGGVDVWEVSAQNVRDAVAFVRKQAYPPAALAEASAGPTESADRTDDEEAQKNMWIHLSFHGMSDEKVRRIADSHREQAKEAEAAGNSRNAEFCNAIADDIEWYLGLSKEERNSLPAKAGHPAAVNMMKESDRGVVTTGNRVELLQQIADATGYEVEGGGAGDAYIMVPLEDGEKRNLIFGIPEGHLSWNLMDETMGDVLDGGSSPSAIESMSLKQMVQFVEFYIRKFKGLKESSNRYDFQPQSRWKKRNEPRGAVSLNELYTPWEDDTWNNTEMIVKPDGIQKMLTGEIVEAGDSQWRAVKKSGLTEATQEERQQTQQDVLAAKEELLAEVKNTVKAMGGKLRVLGKGVDRKVQITSDEGVRTDLVYPQGERTYRDNDVHDLIEIVRNLGDPGWAPETDISVVGYKRGLRESASFLDAIKHGDRVTIVDRFGNTRTGKAVMKNRKDGVWVLNMGGPHGTPGIASPSNIVAINGKKKLLESFQKYAPVSGRNAVSLKIRDSWNGWVDVTGTPVFLESDPEHEYVAIKLHAGRGWFIVEKTTGLEVGETNIFLPKARTKQEAIQRANEKIASSGGPEKISELLAGIEKINEQSTCSRGGLTESLKDHHYKIKWEHQDEFLRKPPSEVNGIPAEERDRVAGSVGIKSNPTTDYILVELDDFYKELYKDVPLRQNEFLFRFYTYRTVQVGGLSPLVKLNLDNWMLYFLDEEAAERDEAVFKGRGEKLRYARLVWEKFPDMDDRLTASLEAGAEKESRRFRRPFREVAGERDNLYVAQLVETPEGFGLSQAVKALSDLETKVQPLFPNSAALAKGKIQFSRKVSGREYTVDVSFDHAAHGFYVKVTSHEPVLGARPGTERFVRSARDEESRDLLKRVTGILRGNIPETLGEAVRFRRSRLSDSVYDFTVTADVGEEDAVARALENIRRDYGQNHFLLEQRELDRPTGIFHVSVRGTFSGETASEELTRLLRGEGVEVVGGLRESVSRFGRSRPGTPGGVYSCGRCGRKTRETDSDAAISGLCGLCYEMSGLENSLSDGTISEEDFSARKAEVEKKYGRKFESSRVCEAREAGPSDHPRTIPELNRWLHQNGVPEEVVLNRGRGYFYFTGGEASRWSMAAVATHRVAHLSFRQWLREYEILRDANVESEGTVLTEDAKNPTFDEKVASRLVCVTPGGVESDGKVIQAEEGDFVFVDPSQRGKSAKEYTGMLVKAKYLGGDDRTVGERIARAVLGEKPSEAEGKTKSKTRKRDAEFWESSTEVSVRKDLVLREDVKDTRKAAKNRNKPKPRTEDIGNENDAKTVAAELSKIEGLKAWVADKTKVSVYPSAKYKGNFREDIRKAIGRFMNIPDDLKPEYDNMAVWHWQKGEGAMTEQTATEIMAEHPGVLELPDGAFVDWGVKKLVDHLVSLAKSKGRAAVSRAVVNLERWNKNQNPSVADKARRVLNALQRDDRWTEEK